MNTKQIECILELAQTHNFNRAAENLCISQPTLTYQIKEVEKEVRFQIFERSGKGAELTPAGSQFCTTLRRLKEELDIAIEQGQNFSRKFKDDITVGMPVRSCLYLLPQAIKIFSKKYKDISITPQFNGFYHPESFLKGAQDVFFTFDDEMKHVPDIKVFNLYKSKIYLLTKKNDSLAKKKKAYIKDLEGKTLMVGGGSPPTLRRLQQKIISSVKIDYFNIPDHETTMTNIASDRGICLTPGFFNDHNGEFAWTNFDCDDYFDCKLCIHSKDKRKAVIEFVEILQKLYQENKDNLDF